MTAPHTIPGIHAEIGRERRRIDAAIREHYRAQRAAARRELVAMLAVLAMAGAIGAMLALQI